MNPNQTEKTETVTESTSESVVAAAAVTSSASGVTFKDLLVPISIVIAGAFISIGLFFGSGSESGELPAEPKPAQPSGDVNAVMPVAKDDWIKGDADASVVVIEYSDFDCPFCSRFHDTMDEIVAESNGEVTWVYRHFPLEQLHPQAAAVSIAAECVGLAAGNDAFWQFTDGYFKARGNGDRTSHGEIIPRLVTETGVSEEEFTSCFETGEPAEKIQKQIQNAVDTGGRGTPWSLVIGPDGTVYPINGAQPKAVIEQTIAAALNAS